MTIYLCLIPLLFAAVCQAAFFEFLGGFHRRDLCGAAAVVYLSSGFFEKCPRSLDMYPIHTLCFLILQYDRSDSSSCQGNDRIFLPSYPMNDKFLVTITDEGIGSLAWGHCCSSDGVPGKIMPFPPKLRLGGRMRLRSFVTAVESILPQSVGEKKQFS